MCHLKGKKVLDGVFITEVTTIVFSIVNSRDVKGDILIFMYIELSRKYPAK